MNCVDQIEGLLRIELSAVETYERAVGERTWDLLGTDQAQHLVSILVDHLEAASQLQATVQQNDKYAGRWRRKTRSLVHAGHRD